MASSAGSRALGLLVCALAMCAQVASAVTPEEVVGWFQQLTEESNKFRLDVERITIFSATFNGPIIGRGLNDINSRIQGYSSGLGPANTNTFQNKDAEMVVQSLKSFVMAHQRLLEAIIGKHGLLTLIPHFEPIRVALVSLESTEDTFAAGIKNRIPTQQAPAANEQFASLDKTINSAIKVYSSIN